MNIEPCTTRVFKEGESLADFIVSCSPKLPNRCILVIASKIVSLSENRTAIINSKKDKDAIIKNESQWALRTKSTWLTYSKGYLMTSAGIDESNGKGKVILLPKNSFKSAEKLQRRLKKHYGIQEFGILIADSRSIPFRKGIVGVAIGYAGFSGIRDYRGKRDIFGRKFKFSKTNVADSLATAAILEMGEGNEQKPFAIISDANVEFREKIDENELVIKFSEDKYRPVLIKK
ncbi:MAG: hypothetical protein EPN86_02505 [Nanoarchaeota archaeon]|nr:MAG: hypothetical protein EPN86_02505 [Nanoarchaeota archaeon]